MSIRRQAYQWEIADLGQLPPKRLEALTEPQSIFTSGFGNANLKARLRTKPTEYLVIKYFGSTPGIYGTGNDWVRVAMSISQLGSLRILPTPMEDPEMVYRVQPPPIQSPRNSALLLPPIGILRFHPTPIGTSIISFLTVSLSLWRHFRKHQRSISSFQFHHEVLLWDSHTIWTLLKIRI